MTRTKSLWWSTPLLIALVACGPQQAPGPEATAVAAKTGSTFAPSDAVAGNNVERNMNKRIVGYRVSVRLDNGQARTFTEPRLDGLRVGDRVRVDGKHVRRA